MRPGSTSSSIDLVEAAYDLEAAPRAWLSRVLRNTLDVLHLDLPSVATTFTMGSDGTVAFDALEAWGGQEVVELYHGWQDHLPKEVTRSLFRPGVVGTFSGLTRGVPAMLSAFQEYWGRIGVGDTLGLTALDCDGQGVVLNVGLAEPRALDPVTRTRWQQVCVHVAAAHRLRRAVSAAEVRGPEGADAIIDTHTMKVEHATGEATGRTARDHLRQAAISVDRARTDVRNTDPDAALAMWKGLVDGRWSLVDWFDSDGRRYMIARRNLPAIRDPRGLTLRERQVVAYAVLGESSKIIAYRLGLAQSTVSEALGSALQKLRISSRTQLVQMLSLESDE